MTFACLIDFPPFILATQKWASARPKCGIQSFLVVYRKCIAAAAAADRAKSVSSVSSILACLSPRATRLSVAPHCLNLTIRLCIHPLISIHLLSADNILTLSGGACCQGSVWSRGLSWSGGIKAGRQEEYSYHTCVCEAKLRSAEHEGPVSLGKDGGWFIHPLRTAPSLSINQAPSLTLRPVH